MVENMFFLDSEHVGMAGNISNGFRKIEVYNSPLKFLFHWVVRIGDFSKSLLICIPMNF